MAFYDDILPRLATPSIWSSDNDSEVLKPYTTHHFIEAFNAWMDVPLTRALHISKAVNMLHNANLMIDDIEDGSDLRRGNPVAHSVFGIPRTLNAANYVYFLAQKDILGLQNSRFPDKDLIIIFTEELISLHRGQGLELLWRESLQCPTEEEYVHMVNDKTSGLLRITIRLMMACAMRNKLRPVDNLIGIFYQIRDDLLNLQSPVYSNTKGFAEDLTEGKFSFPILHGVRADQSDTRILDILKQRPTTPTLKSPVVEYLKTKTRSFEYTLGVLEKLENQARSEIARLGGNVGLERIIDALHVDGATLG
ncbi:isoprenoid synthase domain-containing protein [Mycena olivaceomarginata]|nr:isoprenoid synthase domain-containing protein [Mycena olivaceomarginata]